MENEYVNEQGQRLLAKLKKEGILPSPYNFTNFKVPSLDEYIVHDSTLREGEQTPGVVFSIAEKLEIAKKLDEVGIPQIEAGFPAASEKQRKCVEALVDLNLDAQLSSFARAKKEDIDVVADVGADGIVVSLSISPYHRQYKFKGMTKEVYLEKLEEMISYAESYGLYVIYSAEDTTRENDLEFLKKAYKTAEDAGADRARVVDTLGCVGPNGMAFMVKEIGSAVDIPIEVHCHNDLGLALANSLAAIEAGASTVSTSVNGIGERAGITKTEEIIPVLHMLYGTSSFEMKQLTSLSQLVERISGIKMPPHKPLTGNNVTAHSSGIHQHGVLMNPETYEFYPPRMMGQERKIYIDELGGRHGIIYVAKELGIEISDETARLVLEKIKNAFSREGRRSSYTPQEIKQMIDEIQK
ncbi:MAG: homoaconitate hydratase [Candidatus Bathyarchaeota archaeon]|nr:homoaconitate hydratase [Candidatus Bathyarchaeum tardum]WGM88939.1 MAG: homoaconitate hydratase [Candidatus Bathyarchaeum tardum]WNZ28822.1 MAG: homoaconitate hydratase [Candidatus Bathyarchaeota archaeon]